MPSPADPFDRARVAPLASSERLRLRAYGGAAPDGGKGTVESLRQEMIRQGYYTPPGRLSIVAREAWIAPVLSWDGNINGGVLQGRFWLNGLLFEATPGTRARSGMVGGATLGAMARLSWSEGRTLEIRGQTRTVWSPKHDMPKSDAVLTLCSGNHVAGWTFLDICGTGQKSWRDLGDQEAWQSSATFSRILARQEALHEFRLGLVRTGATGAASHTRLVLGLETIWNRAVTMVSLTRGENVPGTTTLDWRLDAELRGHWRNRPWSLSLWKQELSGGAFLGTPRHDKGMGLTIWANLKPGVDVGLGYATNNSTAGFAGYDQVSLDLRFKALRW